MHIHQLKLLDATIGLFSVMSLPVPSQRTISREVRSFLIIRPGGIGDAILLAPMIHILRANYPDAHITILAERRNADAFLLITGIDAVLCYDKPVDLLKALRGRYNIVVDTEQWHRLSAVVSRLVRSSLKIGFDTNERRRMFTHLIPYDHDAYEAVSFTNLLEPLGIAPGGEKVVTPSLSLPTGGSDKVANLLKVLDGEPFIVIFPGASIAQRRWGVAKFRRLIEILTTCKIKIVIVGGKEDQQQGEAIIRGGLGLNLAGLTTLSESAAVLARSSLVVCGDSGVLHLAVGLNVPTVSLFGPGIMRKWGPTGEKHLLINKELDCSPCTQFGYTPKCPINTRCMTDISVEEVVVAVKRLICFGNEEKYNEVNKTLDIISPSC